MNKISIHEIFKLRKKTGLGIMACKQALIEVNGNIDKAIKILIKKGKYISYLNEDKKNIHGIVIAKTNYYNNIGSIIKLSCETDFVSLNENFINLAKEILDISLLCKDKDSILNFKIDKIILKDKIINYMNILGEKIELKLFKKINTPFVSYYVHNGNKIASIVGFTKYYKGIENIGKNISMQIVATNPKWIDYNDQEIHSNLDKKEIEDSYLLYQSYIKNPKISVKEYLDNFNNKIKIASFKRFSIN